MPYNSHDFVPLIRYCGRVYTDYAGKDRVFSLISTVSQGVICMRGRCVSPFIFIFLIAAFYLIPGGVSATEDEAFTESVVIFNTICAKCHEAQCSGRLSFDDSFDASVNHIVRYYGDASEKEWLQKELFVILNHMKEKCAYYPMPAPIPPQMVWSGEMLEKMATLVERNYFIPIGPFTPGHYQLELKLAKDAKVTVHLVSATFEMVVEDCCLSSDRQIVIPFSIEEAGNHFVRVYPREPVQITRLAVRPGVQSSGAQEEKQ